MDELFAFGYVGYGGYGGLDVVSALLDDMPDEDADKLADDELNDWE